MSKHHFWSGGKISPAGWLEHEPRYYLVFGPLKIRVPKRLWRVTL